MALLFLLFTSYSNKGHRQTPQTHLLSGNSCYPLRVSFCTTAMAPTRPQTCKLWGDESALKRSTMKRSGPQVCRRMWNSHFRKWALSHLHFPDRESGAKRWSWLKNTVWASYYWLFTSPCLRLSYVVGPWWHAYWHSLSPAEGTQEDKLFIPVGHLHSFASNRFLVGFLWLMFGLSVVC